MPLDGESPTVYGVVLVQVIVKKLLPVILVRVWGTESSVILLVALILHCLFTLAVTLNAMLPTTVVPQEESVTSGSDFAVMVVFVVVKASR